MVVTKNGHFWHNMDMFAVSFFCCIVPLKDNKMFAEMWGLKILYIHPMKSKQGISSMFTTVSLTALLGSYEFTKTPPPTSHTIEC